MPEISGTTVTRPLTEPMLENGQVQLGPREAETLGLPAHSGQVTCHYDGETFPADWQARDRVLAGEILQETLSLYGRLGGLLRLQASSTGLELDIVSPSSSTVLAHAASLSSGEPAVAAPRDSTPRRAARPLRESRFRIRDAEEYDWYGNVGIHRPTLERFATRIGEAAWDSGDLFELRLRGEKLATVNEFNELISAGLAKVEPMPHQERTAVKALGSMRGRAILADEVGLGKTIEAGLIMKELMVRGLARRILVLCPAPLRDQWKAELQEKFDETFEVVVSKADSFAGNRLVMSHVLARKNIEKLTEATWDLVIVDEAHKLSGPDARKSRELLRALDSRFKLFLTATPVQNDLFELYRLVELLRPGTFASQREFERRYMDRDNRRMPRDPQALRRLVSDVMIRTTREQAGLDKVKRHPVDVPVTLSGPEAEAYRLCTDLLRRVMTGQYDHLRRRHLVHRLTASPRALATTARKLAESHDNPKAAEVLHELADICRDFGLTNRQRELLSLIERWTADRVEHGKVLVFSQTYETVHDLLRIFADHDIDAVAYHGGLSAQQRQRAISQFRGDIPVMVSTDAGAEGLNLQFANCVVNYDLPWNPMKIEQRIGRVHRVTQHRDVYVANFYAKGTIDEHVYRLLTKKLKMFELLFGQVTTILGELRETKGDGSFEQQLLDAYLSPNDREMKARLTALEHKVEEAYNSAHEMMTSDADISSWLADMSYRDEIVGQATELLPDVEVRSRERHRQVQAFTHELLDALGAEVSYVATGEDFLIATLPDEAADAMGGRHQLHLAFSPEGLDHHREAELCAVGSEVFEDLLYAMRDRGELLVETPTTPEIDPGPLLQAAPGAVFVGRELRGPSSWAAQVHWHVHAGESSLGRQIVTTEMGEPVKFITPQHRRLEAGEPLPETVGTSREITDWVAEASAPQLQARLDELQAETDRHDIEERKRRLRSFDKRIAELRERGYTQWEEIRKLQREREAVRRQRSAEVELRSETLSIRLVGERRLEFVETWRSASGAVGIIDVSWDPWGNAPPHAVGADGHPVRTVQVCAEGHVVDADRVQTCGTCHRIACGACTARTSPRPCMLCSTPACLSCQDGSGLCRSCAQPARDPQDDRDGMVAWTLGGGRKLLVGERIAFLDDELIDKLPRDMLRVGARIRAEARRRGLRPDMGLAVALPDGSLEMSATAFAESTDVEQDWVVDEKGGCEISAEVAHLLPRAGDDKATRQQASPLHAVIERLRDTVPPAPAPQLVHETTYWTSWLEVRDDGLYSVLHVDSGLQDQPLIEATRVEWSRSDDVDSPDVVATAHTAIGQLILRRLHRSHVLQVEGRGSWFIPVDDTADQVVEVTASELANSVGLEPGTAIGLAPIVPLPDGVASSEGAVCASFELEQDWAVGSATPERPLSREDLDLIGSRVPTPHHDLPTTAVDGLRQLVHALDTGTSTHPPVALRRVVTVRATWEGRCTVTRRFEARGDRIARPPLDDTGEPAAEFTIDDHGHLSDPDQCWQCPSCETWRCRACGNDGVLAACTTCDQPACGACRAAEHAAPAAATCGCCGATSCVDCGRNIVPARCELCRRTTCKSCRDGSLCLTCTALAPATDADIAALPAELVASGLDVGIARDQRLTIVTLAGRGRRELALIAGDQVLDWWSIADIGDAEMRLRLAIGGLAGTGDLGLSFDELSAPEKPGDVGSSVLVVTRTTTVEAGWSVRDPSGRQVIRSQVTVPATGESEAELLAALQPSVPNTRIPSAVADPEHRRRVEQVVPTIQRPPAATLHVLPYLRIAETNVTAEGIHERVGTAADLSERLHPWQPGSGPIADEIANWPVAPSRTMHASTETTSAAVARLGSTLLIRTTVGDQTIWYRYASQEPDAEFGTDAMRLAMKFGQPEACGVARLTLPADVAPFTVTNGKAQQQTDHPHVVAAQGQGHARLTTTAAEYWAADVELALPKLDEIRHFPVELGRELDRELGVDVPGIAVAVGVEHRDTWDVPGYGLLHVSYVVQGGARLGLVQAHDTGALRQSLTADRSGHLVESPATCSYCGSLTCVRCEAPVRSCWLCAILVCGRCGRTIPDLPACPACASLERLGWRARRRELLGGAVLRGDDERHHVTVASVDGGARIAVAAKDGAVDERSVVLTQAQANHLNLVANRSLFRPSA